MLVIQGNTYDISRNLIGMNNNFVRETNVWSQAIMRETYKAAEMSTLRFPGGTNSIYWDYANNKVFDDLIPGEIPEEWIRNLIGANFSNPIEELGTLRNTMGPNFDIVFVANLVTPQVIPSVPSENWKWYRELDKRYDLFKAALKRAEAVGIPIKYIELGNEYYFEGGYIGNSVGEGAYPGNGATYGLAANYFATLLKDDYPNAICAAVATSTDADGGERRRFWNSSVIPNLDPNVIDALTIHFYQFNTPPNGFDTEQGVGQTISNWNNSWTNRLNGGATWDAIPITRADGTHWDVWYTEFGSFQHIQEEYWHFAFNVSNAINNWLTNTRATLITNHAWKTAINLETYVFRPYLYALKLWSRASIGCNKATKLTISTPEYIQGYNGQATHEAVIGWLFSNETEKKALFVNYKGTDQTIDIGNDIFFKGVKITSAHTTDLLGSPTITDSEQESNIIVLPPFSVNYVEAVR